VPRSHVAPLNFQAGIPSNKNARMKFIRAPEIIAPLITANEAGA
jgi:hypothetical protein